MRGDLSYILHEMCTHPEHSTESLVYNHFLTQTIFPTRPDVRSTSTSYILFPRSALCGGHFEIGKKDDTKSLSYWRPISFSIPYSFLRCSHFFLFLNFLAMVEFATGDRVFGRQPRAEHRKPKTCKSPPKILYIIYDCNVYLILLLLNRIISEFEKSMRSERQQQ